MSAPGGDWAEQLRRLVDGFRPPAEGDGGVPDGHPAEAAGHCDNRWCPLCQAAAVLRGERPEVTAALADILATASAALRQFAGEPPAGPREAAPADGGQLSDPPGSAPPVQRIDLT